MENTGHSEKYEPTESLEECYELIRHNPWYDFVMAEWDFKVAKLTLAGRWVVLPILDEIGYEGELPADGVELLRLYRQAREFAVLLSIGLSEEESLQKLAANSA